MTTSSTSFSLCWTRSSLQKGQEPHINTIHGVTLVKTTALLQGGLVCGKHHSTPCPFTQTNLDCCCPLTGSPSQRASRCQEQKVISLSMMSLWYRTTSLLKMHRSFTKHNTSLLHDLLNVHNLQTAVVIPVDLKMCL